MERVPEKILRLFWDADTARLDPAAHQRTIIARVLSDGTLDDWRWLVSAYGGKAVRTEITESGPNGRSAIRPEAKALAALLVK